MVNQFGQLQSLSAKSIVMLILFSPAALAQWTPDSNRSVPDPLGRQAPRGPVNTSAPLAPSSVAPPVRDDLLRTLAQAVAWAHAGAGLPPPPANLVATEGAIVRRNYGTYAPDLQSAYLNIDRNFAVAKSFLSEIRASQASAYLRRHLAAESNATAIVGAGAVTAALVQDLYNETIRRNWKPLGPAGVAALSNSIRMGIMRSQWNTLRTGLGRD